MCSNLHNPALPKEGKRNLGAGEAGDTVQFMVVLVLSIVNIALRSVEEDLGFSEKCLQ